MATGNTNYKQGTQYDGIGRQRLLSTSDCDLTSGEFMCIAESPVRSCTDERTIEERVMDGDADFIDFAPTRLCTDSRTGGKVFDGPLNSHGYEADVGVAEDKIALSKY